MTSSKQNYKILYTTQYRQTEEKQARRTKRDRKRIKPYKKSSEIRLRKQEINFKIYGKGRETEENEADISREKLNYSNK